MTQVTARDLHVMPWVGVKLDYKEKSENHFLRLLLNMKLNGNEC